MHSLFGEMIGTFLIVFFGCGSVAVSTIFNTGMSLSDVAMVWGGAVALAIYSTRYLSCAHLNPAISIAMVVAGRMKLKNIAPYILFQCFGAFFGALLC